MDSTRNETAYFRDEYLGKLIEAEYLVLGFTSVCGVDMGYGAKAPYLFCEKGEEQLHLISSEAITIEFGKFGIYKAGNIVKYKFPDRNNTGFKLMSVVIPVMKIPDRFIASLSCVGNSIRGHHNFGTNAEYPVMCVLDKGTNSKIISSIMQNTQCEVSVQCPLGVENGIPLILVSLHSIV